MGGVCVRLNNTPAKEEVLVRSLSRAVRMERFETRRERSIPPGSKRRRAGSQSVQQTNSGKKIQAMGNGCGT